MAAFLIASLIVLFVIELYHFIKYRKENKTQFSHPMLLSLFFTLFVIFIGFSLLYYLLYYTGHVVLVNTLSDDPVTNYLDYLYFSGVTLLSIGYGDYVPVGVARSFSLLQSSLGLLLPSAYFLRHLSSKDQSN